MTVEFSTFVFPSPYKPPLAWRRGARHPAATPQDCMTAEPPGYVLTFESPTAHREAETAKAHRG